MAANKVSPTKRKVANTLGSVIESEAYKRAKQTVTAAMEEDVQIAFRLEHLVRAGKLQDKDIGVQNVLPVGVQKWNFLSKKHCEEFLFLTNVSRAIFDKISVVAMRRLLLNRLCIDDGAGFPTRNMEELREWIIGRFQEVGDRGQVVLTPPIWNGKNNIDYSQCGVFKLRLAPCGRMFSHIVHCNGTEHKFRVDIENDHTIENNYVESKAKLVSPTSPFKARAVSVFLAPEQAALPRVWTKEGEPVSPLSPAARSSRGASPSAHSAGSGAAEAEAAEPEE